jgi:small subunit ribosomal protein S5
MSELPTRIDPNELVLNDKLININRVAKVMKGGKRLSFNALVVTGDGHGHVGIGLGKANEVPVAISKGNAIAKKNLIKVALSGATIPYQVRVKFGAAKVLLKPAPPGTGIIAGGSIRAVLEASGIKDILTKSLGSANRINVAKATMRALGQLKDREQELARRRGTGNEPAEKRGSSAEVKTGGGEG